MTKKLGPEDDYTLVTLGELGSGPDGCQGVRQGGGDLWRSPGRAIDQAVRRSWLPSQCVGSDWLLPAQARGGRPDESEKPLRESLGIREKNQPEAWTTFSTQSMLGEYLLGQKKYSEAEPLLLGGYQGMDTRKKTIPASVRKQRLSEALERIVRLYDEWGKKDKAGEWRKKLPPAKADKKPKT